MKKLSVAIAGLFLACSGQIADSQGDAPDAGSVTPGGTAPSFGAAGNGAATGAPVAAGGAMKTGAAGSSAAQGQGGKSVASATGGASTQTGAAGAGNTGTGDTSAAGTSTSDPGAAGASSGNPGAAGSSNPGTGTAGAGGASVPAGQAGSSQGQPAPAGNGMQPFSSAEIDSLRQVCVDEVNRYRATRSLPAYQRWNASETCVDDEASYDEAHAAYHKAFLDGMTCGAAGQCECGWLILTTSPLSDWEASVKQCLGLMWAEKDLPQCAGCDNCDYPTNGCTNCDFYGGCGHYVLMKARSLTQVACGFSLATGWMAQDYKLVVSTTAPFARAATCTSE